MTASSPLMSTYPPAPVTFVRGEGSWLYDDTGRAYLDLLSGLAVTSLGHSHPDVADALAEQARTLLHVSNLFGTVPGPQVAATLDRLLGGGGQVFFANSGAEANECAIKLARRWAGAPAGRYKVVSALGSFHGRTLATLHATGQPAKHEPFQPLPDGFVHVAWDDLDALAAAIDPSVAAVLLEPVQGEGGVNPATVEYFRGVRDLCDERGVLFMVDEVQTGLGRCGAWFAHQHFGVVPDVVTMAKALGNGVPIGACWARADVAAAFEPGDHATTYGGQPLATAAARAVLAVMEDRDVPARARHIGEVVASELTAAPGVLDVRGLGALIAVEVAVDARQLCSELLGRGVVVNAVTPTALRLAPSLLIDDAELRSGTSSIAETVAEILEGDEN
ncbi:MAG TPA: acetylornithine/succinylornithine family transaminase [Microthrixaceae bacterium]|nr:acetylornithine/succinylornithine family transaminase [Microthrixaceae bacterium]HNN39611.1 acetylornithine/succinylornithine family transaminase [Microthrixaceae bacterium]HPG14979.1 acetylornithine/succinylornithine family transaminase [Microthrixaceae bacterium]